MERQKKKRIFICFWEKMWNEKGNVCGEQEKGPSLCVALLLQHPLFVGVAMIALIPYILT